MTIHTYLWFVSFLSLLGLQRQEQWVARARHPMGASKNDILCPACSHQGQAIVLPNSIEYIPTGWRQFDTGFLVARIVTLVWSLIGLIAVVTLDVLNVEAPDLAPRILLCCYAAALVACVSYAVRYMTPFDNCRILDIVSAPAINATRTSELPYLASADVACGHCSKNFPSVAVVEIIPRTADSTR